jgi:hypothetical protein
LFNKIPRTRLYVFYCTACYCNVSLAITGLLVDDVLKSSPGWKESLHQPPQLFYRQEGCITNNRHVVLAATLTWAVHVDLATIVCWTPGNTTVRGSLATLLVFHRNVLSSYCGTANHHDAGSSNLSPHHTFLDLENDQLLG